MKKIKYLSYYAQKDDKQERSYVLAATNKMDYLCKALNNIGYSVEIVSASYTRNKKHSYSGSYKKLEGTNTLRMFYTFPWGTKFQKLLSIISMNFFIWSDLVFKTKKNETVLVYHSLGYMNAICFAHKIRKFKLILEVEEIYADVLENKVKRKKEINFIKTADAYIFPTELLNGLLNKEEKPYCTIHGTYQVEHKRKSVFNDGKIHVVYAGTFDSRKGGCCCCCCCAISSGKLSYTYFGFWQSAAGKGYARFDRETY